MSTRVTTYLGGPIFDGSMLWPDHALVLEDDHAKQILPRNKVDLSGTIIDLSGDILSPGYVDLQVNGGDGVMLGDAPSVETLKRMASAHKHLGCAAILPTLITDTPKKTRAAIDAAVAACRDGVPGIAGLHLEGPHLSQTRKGAHDGELIRPMSQDDLQEILDASKQLPAIMVTIAPENVSLDQVTKLSQAGIIVSLGHTEASYDTCVAYAKAGARCATHLFNAMSQMGSRNPGLVGAALELGELNAGLIADGIHAHPTSMGIAWRSKLGPGKIFLVSDAMAPAGTDLIEFRLEGRRIQRADGRLTLEDGTLAGADLDLTTAIKILTQDVGVSLDAALQAAVATPASLIGLSHNLVANSDLHCTHILRISSDLSSAKFLSPL